MTTLPSPPRHRTNFKLGAEMGRRIYEEKYKHIYEPQHKGKFLAVDIESGLAGFGGDTSEAMAAGKKVAPGGFFYVVRIGYDTTFDLR